MAIGGPSCASAKDDASISATAPARRPNSNLLLAEFNINCPAFFWLLFAEALILRSLIETHCVRESGKESVNQSKVLS